MHYFPKSCSPAQSPGEVPSPGLLQSAGTSELLRSSTVVCKHSPRGDGGSYRRASADPLHHQMSLPANLHSVIGPQQRVRQAAKQLAHLASAPCSAASGTLAKLRNPGLWSRGLFFRQICTLPILSIVLQARTDGQTAVFFLSAKLERTLQELQDPRLKLDASLALRL